ncbi:MAG: spermidine synthase [Candidatus Dormibacteria bacterium]
MPAPATRLGVVVFTCGAATLATEIAASRLLAPFFGSSTIVWANIIGLILIYLSVGYWYGGRIADRHPSPRRLGLIILVAAGIIALLPFIARPLLRLALSAFSSVSAGAAVASFFATMVLFSVPVTLLGMVSPFAVRLAVDDVSRAGTVAGRLYALSTIGSIAGTFLPALVTIPLIGTQRTMLGAAAALCMGAAVLLRRHAVVALALIAVLILVPPGTVKERAGLIVERESAEQFIQVVGEPDGARNLALNEGVTAHSVWRRDEVLTGGEWDMFLIVPPLIRHPVRRILILGNAGGTTARALGRFEPEAEIDGVEVDPEVTALGRRWLGLGDNPRLVTHDGDARTFLELSHDRWDMIVVDAYRQPYIPFQLATREFFTLAREHLQSGGRLALNVERIPGDERLAHAIEATLSGVFPQVWRWPALRFNELVVTGDGDAASPPAVGEVDPQLRPLADLYNRDTVAGDRSAQQMTDDRAPLEWLTDRSILEYIAAGGALDEQLLPTHPAFRAR